MDPRDHLFLSPSTSEYVIIPHEAVKRFIPTLQNCSYWYIGFNDQLSFENVAFGLQESEEMLWKMTYEMLRSSKTPLQFVQDGVDDVTRVTTNAEDGFSVLQFHTASSRVEFPIVGSAQMN
jgi:hypothetical protein